MTMAKTDAGLRVLRDRQGGLTQRQRAALILFDGQRSLEEVLGATSPGGVTRADIDRLVDLGLVAEVPPHAASQAAGEARHGGERERYLRAYGIATALTGELGARGGGLNLAVEAAASLQELRALAPRIRAAVGPMKFARLEAVLTPR